MTENKPTLLDFNRAIQELAEQLFSLVEGKLGSSSAWERAILDVRSSPDQSTQITKFRITLPGEEIQSCKLTGKTNSLIRDVWEFKQTAFPDQWYGLKLKIQPSGECETEFNYDTSCFDDPSFFDI